MHHLVTLGEFLRAARARLEPADAGFPATARRRVAGLRREELAQLAGVSVDYYTRLEQGRSRTASRAVLDSLASALRLDDAERVHLFDLAARPERVHRPSSPRRQRVTPVVEQVLARLDAAYCPAFVLGRRTDVLAGNRLATALITDFAALPERERNQARFVFLDPYARELYADWEGVAADTAAMLRMDAGRHGADPELSELVGDLSRQSPVFRRLWADQRVTERTEGTKTYHHPVVGELTVTYQAMSVAGEEDQTLFVYTAPDGTADDTALRLLATWAPSPVSPD
ncbi:helix-turn-helix transcriptional regulator [Streptomyces dubilierae]|uniref:Helix-turn-helix transcriptional regulator n=1 Tax=Streptomyces dubilierae TaxID=3075533 RepID=A0ABU2P2B9_9ACTN|nr:helix-turn-helix transcriptional regulator [Streptomyces sp. DSM 41921]MDT0386292.1 helix-turn-helix transcriptional regulator [Streptomyces sp. DSM 41921]